MRPKLYLWMKNTRNPLLIQGYVPTPLSAVVTPLRSYEPHELDPFPYIDNLPSIYTKDLIDIFG